MGKQEFDPRDYKSEVGYALELEAERVMQIDTFIKHGFHTELNLSEDAYFDSFPQFLSQPEAYKGRFEIPLLIDPRISLSKQLELANVMQVADASLIGNITDAPEQPYAIWTNNLPDLYKYRVSARESKGKFEVDEVGATAIEAATLCLQKPDVVGRRSVDAAGSLSVFGEVPYMDQTYLCKGGSKRSFFVGWDYDKRQSSGVLSRGKDVVEKQK
jgi:hypothetical protein